MRKAIALAAVAAVGTTGVAATAYAVEGTQGLTVKTSGSKGTKKKPRNLKLTVTTTTAGSGATPTGTFGTKTAVVFFDKNLKFNYAKFPTCSEAVVAGDYTKCPKGSQVGKGDSSAQVGPSGRIVVTPKVAAFNGGGGKLFLRTIAVAGQPDSSGVLTGKLSKASGAFGQKLTVTIPAKLQNQFGLPITITKFGTAIQATRKGVGYVQSTGCTGGKYQFKATFTYTDDTSKDATATAKC